MKKTKRFLGIAAATAALVAGPASAALAQPVELVLPCEIFKDPYDYPCETAEGAGNFVIGEVFDAAEFVGQVRDEAGEVVFRVYCIAFPNQPECQ